MLATTRANRIQTKFTAADRIAPNATDAEKNDTARDAIGAVLDLVGGTRSTLRYLQDDSDRDYATTANFSTRAKRWWHNIKTSPGKQRARDNLLNQVRQLRAVWGDSIAGERAARVELLLAKTNKISGKNTELMEALRTLHQLINAPVLAAQPDEATPPATPPATPVETEWLEERSKICLFWQPVNEVKSIQAPDEVNSLRTRALQMYDTLLAIEKNDGDAPLEIAVNADGELAVRVRPEEGADLLSAIADGAAQIMSILDGGERAEGTDAAIAVFERFAQAYKNHGDPRAVMASDMIQEHVDAARKSQQPVHNTPELREAFGLLGLYGKAQA